MKVKSLLTQYFQGEQVYNYGGQVPGILFPGTSPSPTPSITPTNTPTPSITPTYTTTPTPTDPRACRTYEITITGGGGSLYTYVDCNDGLTKNLSIPLFPYPPFNWCAKQNTITYVNGAVVVITDIGTCPLPSPTPTNTTTPTITPTNTPTTTPPIVYSGQFYTGNTQSDACATTGSTTTLYSSQPFFTSGQQVYYQLPLTPTNYIPINIYLTSGGTSYIYEYLMLNPGLVDLGACPSPTPTNTPTNTTTPTTTPTQTPTITPTPSSTSSPAADPDATAYLNAVVAAGGSVSSIQSGATYNLFAQLKANGIYNKLRVFYPMLGGTYNSIRIEAKLQSAYYLTQSAGWTYGSSGATTTSNTTHSSYLSTNFSVSGNLTRANTSFSFYWINNYGYTPSNDKYWAGAYTGQYNMWANNPYSPTTWQVIGYLNGSDLQSFDPTTIGINPSAGCYFTNNEINTGGDFITSQINGIPITPAKSINGGSNLPNADFYLGNLSLNNSPYQGIPGTYCFLHLGDGLTQIEQGYLAAIVNQYQVDCGRNVY
jgi:hypothetical protein